MKKILIVDDEKNIRISLSNFLKVEGFETLSSADGNEALNIIAKEDLDAVILDLLMPGIDGMGILEIIKKENENIPVIMLTAHGNTEKAVQAIKMGAYDFLDKPPNLDKLLISLKNALHLKELQEEKKEWECLSREKEKLLGESKAMQELKETIEKVAPLNTRVLIMGESGTGKELAAIAIHNRSVRKGKAFVKVNCAAIPAELFESEFFGHEKGAFTSAISRKIGKFEKANNGTLFLDEVAEIPIHLQPKILRAIQNGEIQRLGSDKEIYVDVRIIAATNKDLEKEIKAGRFREDLYYRLNVFPIRVPPLREHKEDIPLLADHFVKQICYENNFKLKKITKEAMRLLILYDYPGNIRELRNIIERLIILTSAEEITEQDVNKLIAFNKENISSTDLKSKVLQTEKLLIEQTLEKFNWNITKAAKYLGIERSHLYKKMHKFNIERRGVNG